MAGAGYKLFNTGDVLLASEVNTYLQQQVTMVFANAAARTTALSGVLAEGMMSYLQDTNTVEVYNGTSWVNVGNAGDITEVQAGTGITVASGTGPIPVVTNDMATAITAAGDIVLGTGSGTYDNLPIGTTGQVLTADTSVSPYKVKWAAAAAGGGKVLQVVQDTDTTQQSTTSDAYSDTNLSATITPATTGSKILCIAAVSVRVVRSGTNSLGNINLVRTSTQLAETQFGLGIGGNSAEISTDDTAVIVWLDSPSTTSATTYKVQYKRLSSATCTVYAQVSSTSSSLTLIEIGA